EKPKVEHPVLAARAQKKSEKKQIPRPKSGPRDDTVKFAAKMTFARRAGPTMTTSLRHMSERCRLEGGATKSLRSPANDAGHLSYKSQSEKRKATSEKQK